MGLLAKESSGGCASLPCLAPDLDNRHGGRGACRKYLSKLQTPATRGLPGGVSGAHSGQTATHPVNNTAKRGVEFHEIVEDPVMQRPPPCWQREVLCEEGRKLHLTAIMARVRRMPLVSRYYHTSALLKSSGCCTIHCCKPAGKYTHAHSREANPNKTHPPVLLCVEEETCPQRLVDGCLICAVRSMGLRMVLAGSASGAGWGWFPGIGNGSCFSCRAHSLALSST